MSRLAVPCVIVALGLSSCTEIEAGGGGGYEPAKVEHLAGWGTERVTFTEEGGRRTGLRTAAVEHRGPHLVVPHEALIYDGEGRSHVYWVRAPLTFDRLAVEVERVVGDDVMLSFGPTAGSHVVTVGSAQVYGAELGIAGGH